MGGSHYTQGLPLAKSWHLWHVHWVQGKNYSLGFCALTLKTGMWGKSNGLCCDASLAAEESSAQIFVAQRGTDSLQLTAGGPSCPRWAKGLVWTLAKSCSIDIPDTPSRRIPAACILYTAKQTINHTADLRGKICITHENRCAGHSSRNGLKPCTLSWTVT